MHVLLSIKPIFAKRIFNGTKKYEYRKTIFQRQDIEGVLVYASTPIRQVVGEFDIEEIIHDDINNLWKKTKNCAGISRDNYFKYFADKSDGYAIKIKAIRLYSVPLPLKQLTIFTPPQSFCYVNTPQSQHSLYYNLTESDYNVNALSI